jgi:hypothetical protein
MTRVGQGRRAVRGRGFVYGLAAGGFALAAVAGCIRRTAPPATAGGPTPGAATAPAATPASEDAQREAMAQKALAEANARIADKPRSDLIAAAWATAFKPEGEVRKVEVAPLAVTGQPFPSGLRVNIKEGSGSPWGVQLVASTAAPVAQGDAILATFYPHGDAAGGERGRDGVRVRARSAALQQGGPVPGAGGVELDQGAGALPGRQGLRRR